VLLFAVNVRLEHTPMPKPKPFVLLAPLDIMPPVNLQYPVLFATQGHILAKGLHLVLRVLRVI